MPTELKAKTLLLHQYLHNLQAGINCLNFKDEHKVGNIITIHIPYKTISKNPLRINVIPIYDSSWATEDQSDYPILLTDGGINSQNFTEHNHKFNIKDLIAWQLYISSIFHNLIDIKSPSEIFKTFHITVFNPNPEIICLSSYHNLDRQLCTYITFLLTIQIYYLHYFKISR